MTTARVSKIRRIVTGHDHRGRSIVEFDDGGTNRLDSRSFPGLVMHELWATAETPARPASGVDRALRRPRIEPEPQGSVFRVIELPPEDMSATVDHHAADAEFGLSGQSERARAERHHTMHRTLTIDYLVVLSGEMWMLVDDGEVLLTPGTCVVQQATSHGFSNRSNDFCVFAAVLIEARP